MAALFASTVHDKGEGVAESRGPGNTIRSPTTTGTVMNAVRPAAFFTESFTS